MKKVINLGVPQSTGNFLTRYGSIGYPRRILLQALVSLDRILAADTPRVSRLILTHEVLLWYCDQSSRLLNT